MVEKDRGNSKACVGGLIGACGDEVFLENCTAEGQIIINGDEQANVGGLVGYAEGNVRIKDCSSNVKILRIENKIFDDLKAEIIKNINDDDQKKDELLALIEELNSKKNTRDYGAIYDRFNSTISTLATLAPIVAQYGPSLAQFIFK